MVLAARRSCVLLALVLVIVAHPALVAAHGNSNARPGAGISATARAHAEQLTLDLVALNAEYHVGGPSQRPGIETRMEQLASTRAQALAAMLDADPAAFLRVALPASIRATLPPSVQAHTEEETDIEGTLEVLHEDWPAGGGDRYVYNLVTPIGRLALAFADDPLNEVTGTRIRAHGIRLLSTLALGSGATSTQTLATALPNTLGAQSTLVILVNFKDKTTQPYTIADAQSVVFTTTSNFFRENSYGQTWLTGTVVGWYTLNLSSTVCDPWTLASYAKQAASGHGVNLSSYKRFVYVFPKNACGWAGYGTVGGSPSDAWVNANFSLRVVGHELGHGLGLYHSHRWDCGTLVLTGTCEQAEYGDVFDIMGQSSNHFNASQKERLGWLNAGSSPPITTVTANGTYTLTPYETPGGAKALKILQNASSNTYYYLEYRQALGFDASISKYPSAVNGVLAHTSSPSNRDSSRLLDMTSATSSWYDPALATGVGYYDAAAAVLITPAWTNSTNAGVTVAFGTMACAKSAPTIAVSPLKSQWVAPGTNVAFTVTTTNHDGIACAPSTFNVSATVPSGWAVTYTASPVTIAPGGGASSTVHVTSPLSATGGFSTIGLKTTDSASATRTASTSATYVIPTSASVTVTTDQASYARGAHVKITTTVRNNGVAVVGANVTVTMTRSNGTKTTFSATTGTAGNATVGYDVKLTDPTGTYTTVSKITAGGGSMTGQGSKTFAISP